MSTESELAPSGSPGAALGAADSAAFMRSCPNCGAPAAGRYCESCGQDNRHRRLETRTILAETVGNLVGWDAKLWRTLRGLVVAPATVVCDYAAGRRQRYVNPARFCLIALALWLVATRLAGLDAMELAGFEIHDTSPPGGDAARGEQVIEQVRTFLGANLEILLYLALPIRALLLRFAFRRSGRNLAENMALVFFLAGFGYCLSFLTLPLAAVGYPGVDKVVSLLWFVRALHGFHGGSWWSVIWRGLLVVFFHLLATVVFFGAIAAPWVLWIEG